MDVFKIIRPQRSGTLNQQRPLVTLVRTGAPVNFFDGPASAAVMPIATSLKTYYQLKKQS